MVRSIILACSTLLILASPAHAQERPPLLMPLYLSNATLQGLDIHSTIRALGHGHKELNPLFRDQRPAVMIAGKVGATALSVWVTEKLWKNRNRRAAVLLQVGVNVAMTAVVANNYRLPARSPRSSP